MAGSRTQFVLHTPLSPQQVVEALRDNLDPDEPSSSPLAAYKGYKPMIGLVQGDKFRCFRRPGLSANDLAGDCAAQIIPEGSGARIIGEFVRPQYRIALLALTGGSPVTRNKLWLSFGVVQIAIAFLRWILGSFNESIIGGLLVGTLWTTFFWIRLKMALSKRAASRDFIIEYLKIGLRATLTRTGA